MIKKSKKKSSYIWSNRSRWFISFRVFAKKNYIVHGVKRKSSSFNTDRINHIYNNKKFKLHYGDIIDSVSVSNLINKIKPK